MFPEKSIWACAIPLVLKAHDLIKKDKKKDWSSVFNYLENNFQDELVDLYEKQRTCPVPIIYVEFKSNNYKLTNTAKEQIKKYILAKDIFLRQSLGRP